MRKLSPLGIIAAALLATAGLALSMSVAHAEPEVTGVEVQASGQLTVGDRFHYIIRVEGVEGTQFSIEPGSLPIVFEVSNTPDPKIRSLGSGRIEATFDLDIAAFIPGNVPIPPIAVQYQEPGGNSGTILTPQGLVQVTSVLPPGEEASLRDLKPQMEIGTAPQTAIYFAALGVIVALLVVVLAVLWRVTHPKPVKAPLIATVELGPEDRAREVLQAAADAFTRDRDFAAYYGVIAVTMRNYLTERYGFHAFALTTVELAQEMNRRGIDRWQARLVNGLLTQCDAAVYARYQPALERADHDMTAAYEIVEMSRPKPPAPIEAQEEAAVS